MRRAAEQPRGYPSDLTDAQWQVIAGHLPPEVPGRRGRPRVWPLRRIVEAISYLDRAGCAWRYLPSDYPPWGTIRFLIALSTKRAWRSVTQWSTAAMMTRSRSVWGIRFATPEHGFVFGDGLWESTDGGQHWTSAAHPGGSILSLAVIDGQVLALTAACTAQGGCAQPGTLLRRPLAGGAWSQVTQVHTAGITDATDLIATQAGVAAVLDGNDVMVTSNGGITVTRHLTPCATH